MPSRARTVHMYYNHTLCVPIEDPEQPAHITFLVEDAPHATFGIKPSALPRGSVQELIVPPAVRNPDTGLMELELDSVRMLKVMVKAEGFGLDAAGPATSPLPNRPATANADGAFRQLSDGELEKQYNRLSSLEGTTVLRLARCVHIGVGAVFCWTGFVRRSPVQPPSVGPQPPSVGSERRSPACD